MYADTSSTYYGFGESIFKKIAKKPFPYILGGAAIAGGIYAAQKYAPGAGTAIADFFKSSGMSQGAAEAAAQAVIAGKQPVPPQLQTQLQQAGFLSGGSWILPVALIGGASVLWFALSPKSGGKSRGR